MKKAKAGTVEVFVGTRKGGFLLRSDRKRKKWKVEGPFFAGTEVNCLLRDHRTGKLWAAVNSIWWGHDIQCSFNDGKTWRKSSAGLEFAPERK